MSDRKLIALSLCAAGVLAGCGQTGKLYLPEPAGEVVTRPTQTPARTPGDGNAPANTPQTVDSPPHPDTPTPEVTEPESQSEDQDKKDGKKKD